MRVVWVARRFINNLNLPLEPGESFQTYLHKLVDVPDEAPQVVELFSNAFIWSRLRVVKRNLDIGTGWHSLPAGARVILDVDAFIAANLKPADRELWSTLERLRELKNRGFFGTITETAAELYE